jgi:hypothetical protein
MKTPTDNDDGSINGALWCVAGVGLLLTVGAPFLFGVRGIVSSALGALLAVVNLWAIARLVRGFLGRGAKASWAPLAMLKLVLIFGLLALVLKQGLAEALPLAYGYAALPLGIVLAQLKAASPASGEN